MRRLHRLNLLLVSILGMWLPGTGHAQSIEISSSSGSGLNDLATNSARTYNFGITTLGAGQSLVFTNIGIFMNRANGTTDPFTVTIFSNDLGGGAKGPDCPAVSASVPRQTSKITLQRGLPRAVVGL